MLARLVERMGTVKDSGGGTALALGAFLDGIPEQTVLGLGLAGGSGVSVGLILAIFVSNLPEAIGSATDMRAAGTPPRQIRLLWFAVAGLCALATPLGYFLARETGGHFQALINGFAAGALLVLLVDSLIPEATEKSGRVAGLATTLGFAVAAGLSTLTAYELADESVHTDSTCAARLLQVMSRVQCGKGGTNHARLLDISSRRRLRARSLPSV